jgi:hypothetical protein
MSKIKSKNLVPVPPLTKQAWGWGEEDFSFFNCSTLSMHWGLGAGLPNPISSVVYRV